MKSKIVFWSGFVFFLFILLSFFYFSSALNFEIFGSSISHPSFLGYKDSKLLGNSFLFLKHTGELPVRVDKISYSFFMGNEKFYEGVIDAKSVNSFELKSYQLYFEIPKENLCLFFRAGKDSFPLSVKGDVKLNFNSFIDYIKLFLFSEEGDFSFYSNYNFDLKWFFESNSIDNPSYFCSEFLNETNDKSSIDLDDLLELRKRGFFGKENRTSDFKSEFLAFKLFKENFNLYSFNLSGDGKSLSYCGNVDEDMALNSSSGCLDFFSFRIINGYFDESENSKLIIFKEKLASSTKIFNSNLIDSMLKIVFSFSDYVENFFGDE